MSDILTTAAQSYMTAFSGYVTQFLAWGQWLFFSLVAINIVWLTLRCAFEQQSLSESMPHFIKRFFVIAFFYTLMMNPAWLSQLMQTAQSMGSTLTNTPIDPSSLISEGIGIGNKIIVPIWNSSILTSAFSVIIISIVYIIVLFVFISIALELALTMIVTTALISAATFFLGFGALDATSSFARQTLDLILGNCVKLLGIYLVVAAGSQTITAAVSSIPASIIAFDPYAWIVAVVLLFWMVAKHLPPQMARIVSGSVLDSPHTNAAAMALATIRYAELATSAVTLGAQMTDRVAQGISHLAGHPVDSQSADYFQSANRQPTTSSEVEQSSSTTLTAPHSKPKDIT